MIEKNGNRKPILADNKINFFLKEGHFFRKKILLLLSFRNTLSSNIEHLLNTTTNIHTHYNTPHTTKQKTKQQINLLNLSGCHFKK